MRKTKGEARRLPRGVKLLSIAAALVLTCVLAVSLIGTSFAAGEYVHGPWSPVEGIQMSVTVPASELEKDGTDGFSTWEPTTEGDFALTAVVASSREGSSNHFNEKKRTLVIENTTGSNITLKFKWSREQLYLDGSVTCSLDGALGTSTFNGIIPAHGSVSLTVTSNSGDVQGVPIDELPMQTVTLSNFSVVQAATYTLNLLPAEHGAYSANNGTVTVNSSEKDETISYDPTGKKVTLTATAAADYKFYLWEDEYHTPISTENPLTNYGPDSKGNSIRAVFVKSDMEASYHIGNANYYYWEDAMRAANAAIGDGKYIITDNKAHSVTLPKDAASASRFEGGTYVKQESDGLHYVIPSGVKLVVPYSSKYSTATDDAINTHDEDAAKKFGVGIGSNASGKAYVTLTVPTDVVMDVAGTLNVNALQGSSNGAAYASHVIGDYGKMVVGGKINVYGTFYARGYVIDEHHTATLDSGERTGLIYAHPGAQVYQMLQMADWRGGHYTKEIYKTVMPINTYYLQNIMVETTYQMGASMSAQVVVAASIVSSYTTKFAEVPLITNGEGNGSLFVMKAAGTRFTTRYDYQTDQLKIFLENGKVDMNYLTLSVKVGISDLEVSTKNLQLTLSDNMPITVKSGSTLTVNYGLKLWPGAAISVEEGANLIIADNSEAAIYLYAKQDYSNAFSRGSFRTRLDTKDIVNKPGTAVSPVGDAQLNLEGTLTVKGLLAISDNHLGIVAAGPKAKIVVEKVPTSNPFLKEPYQALKDSGAAEGTTISGYSKALIKKVGTYSSLENWKYVTYHVYYVQNSAWKAPSGPMVNDGAVTAFEKATYKAVPAGNSTYNWTRYTLNVNYVDAAGKPVTGLTPEKLYSIDGTASFRAPDGYAITDIKADASNSGLVIENATTVDDGKTKLANAVTDGCTDVNLSNIAADGTITVTVKQYNHTVRWNFANIAENDKITSVFLSYLAGGETEASRTAAQGAVIDSNSVAVKKANGSEFPSTTSSVTGTDPRVVRVTGITENAVVTVRYSANRSVTWNVTIDGVTVAPDTVKLTDSSEATYTLDQTGSVWQTVALEGGVTYDTTTGIAVKDRTDVTDAITVKNVYSDVTVNIAITTYAHKVSGTITTVNGDTTAKTTITPFFTNETVYKPAPEGSGKYIVSQYQIDGGTLAGKAMQSVSTILPADAEVKLTGKEVDIKLTFQSYVAVWQWNAAVTGAANVPADLSYTEYLTDKRNGTYENQYGESCPKYRTLRSNGTEGWYYAELGLNYGQAGIAYAIPEGRRYVLSSDQTNPGLTTDRGSTKLEDWSCSAPWGGGSAWSLEFLGSQPTLNEDMPSATVTVNLVPYAYEVTFMDQKDAVLEKFCAAADGTNAATGKAINFCVEGGTRRFAKAYEITTDKGTPAINDVTGLKQDKVAIPLDPWDDDVGVYGCTLTGVEADTTVKLTLDSYEKMAIWRWTVGDRTQQQITFLQGYQSNSAVSCYQVETSQFTKWTVWAYKDFDGQRTGYCPQFTIPADGHYYISEAFWRNKVGADAKSCEGEPSDDRVVKYEFTLTPYDASLTWSVDGGVTQYTYISGSDAVYVDHESSEPTNKPAQDTHYNAANKTWTYYPADGRLIKGVDSHNCTVHPAADKLSLAVTNLQANSTVNIVTQMPTTALEGYYMGDMSFEWVRNAAVYTFDADGKTASWKPVDSFAWRHAAGSRSFTVTEDDTITVANGSIYFINSTSAEKTYTIKLERTDNAAAESALKLVVDGEEFAAAGDTVTIPAHTSQTVVCTLSGTPTESELAAGEIGHITVTESNG